MSFLSPNLLWGLLLIPVLLAGYLLLQRRRMRYALRFTNVDLLANIVDKSPRWRRHVPPAIFLLALAALLVAGALGGCQQKAAAPAVAAATPAPVVLPQGSGCGPAIGRTQAVVDSDVATGNLNKPVGDRFSADLAHASAACAAGRDGEALHLLAAAKSRYGYP